MRKILFFLFVSLTQVVAQAAAPQSLKQAGDSAYAKEAYAEAVKYYSKAERTAAVCYNLGNCYYRMDEMAKAVLWYERAYILSPGDADIRFNLDLARSKTIDKVVPQHELFLFEWYRWAVNLMSVDAWARCALVFFLLCLVASAIYLVARPLWMRKSGFALAVLFLLLTLLGNGCALAQRHRLTHRSGAIIMSASTVAKSTPAQSGKDLFVLHEGTRVEIRDNGITDWCEVELADGKIGWVSRKHLELI